MLQCTRKEFEDRQPGKKQVKSGNRDKDQYYRKYKTQKGNDKKYHRAQASESAMWLCLLCQQELYIVWPEASNDKQIHTPGT